MRRWAAGAEFGLGSFGAGTGATTATLKGGVGSASLVLPSGHVVGALVAVNAVGAVVSGHGPHFHAAAFEVGDEFGGLGPARSNLPLVLPATKLRPGESTTIGIVATDAALDKAQATRLAVAAHDGIARAVVPTPSRSCSGSRANSAFNTGTWTPPAPRPPSATSSAPTRRT